MTAKHLCMSSYPPKLMRIHTIYQVTLSQANEGMALALLYIFN
jgi:hypothetical protein